MNELDENAVEAALTMVEAHGGEVTALTVGGTDAVAAVRKAMQLGAHHAVHVSDDAIAGSDVRGTARVLAAAVTTLQQERHVDVVVTGMTALDGMTSLLPTMLAAELEWPALTLASDVELESERATIVRHLPDVHEEITAPLPAVISVTDALNTPRYPNFQMIMAARKAEITTWSLADIGVDSARVGRDAAGTRVLEAQIRPPQENREIIHDTGDGGQRLAEFLKTRGFA